LSRISWTENTEGGFLMLVAIQPPETALQEMLEGPPPEEAKDFKGRMAVFWAILPGEYGRVRLSWRIAEVSETTLLDACAQVNDMSLGKLALVPDLGEAPLSERLQNLRNTPPPLNSLPFTAADPQTLRDYRIIAKNVTVNNNVVQVADAEGNVIVQQQQDGSQYFNFFDYDHNKLAADLGLIKAELGKLFPGDERLSDLEQAVNAARVGDTRQLRNRLRQCGNWILSTVKEMVPELAASAIKASLGLP
jgi:hypothetical protein